MNKLNDELGSVFRGKDFRDDRVSEVGGVAEEMRKERNTAVIKIYAVAIFVAEFVVEQILMANGLGIERFIAFSVRLR